ncbi:MAG: type II toxin-antitoxin system VapC family toxin [Sulfuricellaceae bacterium]|nr:type II toxin-antitoxin system VapC family toxin [Sulfuricellaceae bacterium]
MRILLDTHILLWALVEPEKLPAKARILLEDSTNEVLFSAASIWEITIKAQAERVDFSIFPEEIATAAEKTGFAELRVSAKHAAAVHSLPLHHRDPFDRILVAQAITEPTRLLTVDSALGRYSELVEML